jgi:hypothetical protein
MERQCAKYVYLWKRGGRRGSSAGKTMKKGCGVSVYHEENSRIGGAGASQRWLLVGDGKDTGRRKGYTDLSRPFKLDDLVSILIDVILFLRMVSPVLDDNEQWCPDEPY